MCSIAPCIPFALLIATSILALTLTSAVATDITKEVNSPLKDKNSFLAEDWRILADEKADWFLTTEVEGLEAGTDNQAYGQICGNDIFCQAPLVCTNVGFGERCLPTRECLGRRLEAFTTKYDMWAIKSQILDHAGVSELDLIKLARNSQSRQSFVESATFLAVMESYRVIIEEPAQELWKVQRACGIQFEDGIDDDEGMVVDGNSTSRQNAATGVYFGLHLEAGLIAVDISGDFIEAEFGKSYYRGCLGAEFGASLEISFVLGRITSGNLLRFPRFSVVSDIDIGAAASFGAAGGIAFNGSPFVEYTFGYGVGLGAGVSLCAALPA